MKYFLLIAGDSYYPEARTGNWIACYDSESEAQAQVSLIEHKRTITKGHRKGQEETTHTSFAINGIDYDWYDIVDLRDWINK